jgi:CHRD domain
MRKRTVGIFTILVTGVALLVAVSVASGSSSATTYTAKLTAGQEVPKPAGVPSGATGTFTATLTGSTLKWTLTYSHLSGAAQAAHIHLGKKGVAGNVIVPLCATPTTCKSPIKGSAKVSAAWIKDMTGGKTYVNIHTKKNLNGEIRGQVGM